MATNYGKSKGKGGPKKAPKIPSYNMKNNYMREYDQMKSKNISKSVKTRKR